MCSRSSKRRDAAVWEELTESDPGSFCGGEVAVKLAAAATRKLWPSIHTQPCIIIIIIMRRWVFWCTAVLGALLAAIAIPLAIKFVNLEEGQPFALLMTHNHSVNPEAYHSRYRGAEYAGNKQQFFQ